MLNSLVAKIRHSEKPTSYWVELVSVSDLPQQVKTDLMNWLEPPKVQPTVVHDTTNLWQNVIGLSH